MLIKGHLQTDKPLEPAVVQLLNAMSDTPRYARDISVVGAQFGIEGEFYYQTETDSAIQPLRPPATQPSMVLDWYMDDPGEKLYFKSDSESVIHAEKWLHYLITRFFQPKGILLSGKVQFIRNDQVELELHVQNNQVKILP